VPLGQLWSTGPIYSQYRLYIYWLYIAAYRPCGADILRCAPSWHGLRDWHTGSTRSLTAYGRQALKELVFKQSHASLLLSKVERGRFAFAGALDLLELSGGAQLIITPLMLICVDPQRTRHALWTLPMRLVLSAHMATSEERRALTAQLEVSLVLALPSSALLRASMCIV
jgi:hypothetical protein